MFLIIGNSNIFNLNNIANIEVKSCSDNQVKISIATTAISYIPSDPPYRPARYDCLTKEFIIEKDKWFELLEAIQHDKIFFACEEIIKPAQVWRERF